MILNFLKEISLETLRKNIEINLENYKSATNDWIFKFFDDNSPFLEFKKEVPQFDLDMSSERPEKTDLENIRTLYSSMKNLSVVEASNENLWAGKNDKKHFFLLTWKKKISYYASFSQIMVDRSSGL